LELSAVTGGRLPGAEASGSNQASARGSIDGTLVDTINLYKRACIQAMEHGGLKFSEQDFDRLYPMGTSFNEWILRVGGTEAQVPALRTKRDDAYCELLRQHTVFYAGATELLHSIQDRPSAIVTGSWKRYVDAIDELLDVTAHVDRLVVRRRRFSYFIY
jgi:beta-phosphoglucomutase-like phosphatase (HAD superfamily)